MRYRLMALGLLFLFPVRIAGAETDAYPAVTLSSDTELWTIDAPWVTDGQLYFDPSTGTITGCDKNVTAVDCPAVIDDVPVLSIASWAFADSSLSVFICPDSMESIGSHAFSGCPLETICLPDNIAALGTGVFENCAQLTEITLSGGLTEIPAAAFSDCERLQSVTVLEGVTAIRMHAFKDCTSLSNLILPDTVRYMDIQAFEGCTSLTSAGPVSSDCAITFGWTEAIPDYAFSSTELKSVIIPNGITSIGDGAFSDCPLESITLPESVTKIGDGAFLSSTDETLETLFADVPADSYYADAVLWAAKNGIVSGQSSGLFAPDAPLNRGQAVFMLWRALNSPETLTSVDTPKDISDNSVYAAATVWALENGITVLDKNKNFNRLHAVTRAQFAVFLYRLAGTPDPGPSVNLSDVSKGHYYTDAVTWTVNNNIASSQSANVFGTEETCTRAQAVTMLYRYFSTTQ